MNLFWLKTDLMSQLGSVLNKQIVEGNLFNTYVSSVNLLKRTQGRKPISGDDEMSIFEYQGRNLLGFDIFFLKCTTISSMAKVSCP